MVMHGSAWELYKYVLILLKMYDKAYVVADVVMS